MSRFRIALAALSLALFPSALCVAQAVTPAQLEALSGEYTDANEPDTPVSFYVRDGKLVVETERNVPVELKPNSAVEFTPVESKSTFRFTLDAAGRAVSLIVSTEPNDLYHRTGEPCRICGTPIVMEMAAGRKLYFCPKDQI